MADIGDAELERLALDELLKEAKRGKARAETMGPAGWQSCPLPPTNKRFFHNMIVSTIEPRVKKQRRQEKDETHVGTRKREEDTPSSKKNSRRDCYQEDSSMKHYDSKERHNHSRDKKNVDHHKQCSSRSEFSEHGRHHENPRHRKRLCDNNDTKHT